MERRPARRRLHPTRPRRRPARHREDDSPVRLRRRGPLHRRHVLRQRTRQDRLPPHAPRGMGGSRLGLREPRPPSRPQDGVLLRRGAVGMAERRHPLR
ncbi:hypothetical protein CMK11_02410 [Candidatus Poribacteria bacterium]|nr:hypothetical protein [Candidatus Poribacteria bacterium]